MKRPDANERLARLRVQFWRGAIGEPTLRMGLEFIGLRGQEVQAEINLAKLDYPGRKVALALEPEIG